MFSELKKSARQYPGSYTLGTEGRMKFNGSVVTYIAYTNPNNSTGACYIEYRTNKEDYSFCIRNLDLFNTTAIEEHIKYDIKFRR